MYEQVYWWKEGPPRDDLPLTDEPVRGAPQKVNAGLASTDRRYTPPEIARPPFWEYDVTVNRAGLRLTKVNVRDTPDAVSPEPVFDFIDFSDLEVEFADGPIISGEALLAAMAAGTWKLWLAENGERVSVKPPDKLFQRGVRLEIAFNALHGFTEQGSQKQHRCDVTVEMVVSFRGAANDFDPGGIPVALDLWPQISFKWTAQGSTKRVKRFRGTVRFQLHNRMRHMDGVATKDENVAGLYTDSNASMDDNRVVFLPDLRAVLGSFAGLPFGWLMVFDYLTGDLAEERQIVGVYGPEDGSKFRAPEGAPRQKRYVYGGLLPSLTLRKMDRQGDYDNCHIHARMPQPDRCGNVQIHAPFCGHSCVHLHWRWSPIAVTGADKGRGWQFKGWSSPKGGGKATAFTTNGAPLVPPNQRVTFAITSPGTDRYSRDEVFESGAPDQLDKLKKLCWYTVDVIDPQAEKTQVIFEQGMGWSYRYAVPAESSTLFSFVPTIDPGLLLERSPSQGRMNRFFEDAYEVFRYRGDSCQNQVPYGDYSHPVGTAMEDL